MDCPSFSFLFLSLQLPEFRGNCHEASRDDEHWIFHRLWHRWCRSVARTKRRYQNIVGVHVTSARFDIEVFVAGGRQRMKILVANREEKRPQSVIRIGTIDVSPFTLLHTTEANR